MRNKWIKKGDKVVVLSGNDKGKVGEVLSRTEKSILVQGVNVRKKHIKQRSESTKSEIISVERPIHISNVALSDKDGKKIKLVVAEGKGGKRELHIKGATKNKVHRTL